jgi:YidC/Oxa1 family membrane protein insertase
MALYKTNEIKPLMGCLPLLLQMPFFFALYSALANSVDLWNAPFIFWMKDLSMPDTIATLSGFNVNILPIIMTVSTFFQTKLSTVDTGQTKQQKMLMMAMPVFFIFIFWTMPSGLVLYWIMQNILQIANQLIVNKFGKVK